MSNFIQNFISNFNLWTYVLIEVPLLLTIFFFVFGYNFVRQWVESRKIKKFMSAGGLHTDNSVKKYYE